MFLSIIIPVFNSERYIAQCLDSCINQDLPLTDYEIICVNDGSTDNSSQILKDYSMRYHNIVVVNKENEGCSVARNVGMDLARGDYLWFVDNDDLIAKNKLSTLMSIIKGTNGQVDCFEFPYCSFVDSDVNVDGSVEYNRRFIPHGHMIGCALWPQVFRREFIIQNGLRHRGKRTDVPFYGFGMDALFLFECKKSCMRSQFILEDSPIYFYRRASHSITTDLSLRAHRARVYEYLDILPIILNYYQNEKSLLGQATESTANFLMDYVRTLLDFVAQMPENIYSEARHAVQQAGYSPFTQPTECTYTCSDFANAKNGRSKIRNIIHFYILTNWGLTAATMCYRYHNKIRQIKYAITQTRLIKIIRELRHK